MADVCFCRTPVCIVDFIPDNDACCVKFFNTSKGYGFISETTTKTDYFVHFTGISGNNKTLTEGQKVTFDVMEDSRTGKTRACNVK